GILMRLLRIIVVALACANFAAGQQQWPVTSIVNEPTIAGRAVQPDAQGKLLPWPMAEDTGFSYSSHFLTPQRQLGRGRQLLFVRGSANHKPRLQIDRLGNDGLVGLKELKRKFGGALADGGALLVHAGKRDAKEFVVKQIAAANDRDVFRNP